MFPSLGRLALCAGLAWLSFVDTAGAQQMLQGTRVSRPRDTSPITILSDKKPFDNGLGQGRCTKDIECGNYACCNGRTGECGYDPEDHCYKDNCSSNCDAKAECGKFAEIKGAECPIHVCCSKHGFCGTEQDFCTDGCQSNCFQGTKKNPHTSNVQDIVIGYVEGWAFTRRGCANRKFDHIRVDSITHLFASFAYIKPKTFEVYPMPSVSEESIMTLVNLKKKAPGLKVWIAIGGWSYNDPGDTQDVFHDLSSSAENRNKFIAQLEKFMIYYGFDGVDFDWEYPGAKDRGGKPEDGANYAKLMQDTRNRFKTLGRGWGISFTAPSSYWYMRHFDIKGMMPHVDFVNLMTYDLYGSWDKESDWIGPRVYGHTNLTVIKTALDLLWRNDVPANQVNLGLGFYGRTYVLEDSKCDTPGCKFSDPGRAGQCSGQGGYMSYSDIAYTRKAWNPKVITDKKDTIKYFKYDEKQWVSFDDEETLKWKVEFANAEGLRGLFIWAITQDTPDNSLLDAVLQPKGLGAFEKRNGVHSGADSIGTNSPDKCFITKCGESCRRGTEKIESIRCDSAGGKTPERNICCPVGAAFDPKYCQWRADKSGSTCSDKYKCKSGEEKLAHHNWFKNGDGKDESCSGDTKADYCCQTETENGCSWSKNCYKLNTQVSPCADGTVPLSTKDLAISLRANGCDIYDDWWSMLCCDKNIEPKCRWLGEEKDKCVADCRSDEVNMGRHGYGGMKDCKDPEKPAFIQFPEDGEGYGPDGRLLCCTKDSVRVKHKGFNVPMENLFDSDWIDKNDEQSFNIDVDVDGDSESLHPNDNTFGWHIMSGPPDELTSINKRDGSHWEVYGCDPEHHEGVQTARLVCTKDLDHNCDDIRMGGVVDTVIEMPGGCGPGKYALAIGLEPLHKAEDDEKLHQRVKRGLPEGAQVYELTFDYGFHRLQGRADNNVKIRIDYANTPGYWDRVVAAAKGSKSRRDLEAMEHEVKHKHGNDWKRYLDHTWREDRRTTPPEKLHELHARWLGIDVGDWIDTLSSVNKKYTLLDQKFQKTLTYDLIKAAKDCTIGGQPVHIEANLYATLNADIQTSSVLSLIGKLTDLKSFRHSYLNFRNKGDIQASIVFNALGELRIPYQEETLFGVAVIGASFVVPGIITIGPEFKVSASIEGKVSVEADARVDLQIAQWDYSQRYPAEDDKFEDNKEHPKKSNLAPRSSKGDGPIALKWSVEAEGVIKMHVIPMISLGIDFNPSLKIPGASFDLGVDGYMRVHGYATVGSGSSFESCIGAEAGYDVFARVTAPTIFGKSLNHKWSIKADERSIFETQGCNSSPNSRRAVLMALEDASLGQEQTLAVNLLDSSEPSKPVFEPFGFSDPEPEEKLYLEPSAKTLYVPALDPRPELTPDMAAAEKLAFAAPLS